jgi:hypothetical protein
MRRVVRVFLDANVLFIVAHNPNGKAAFLISLGSTGLLQLATSAYAQEEARGISSGNIRISSANSPDNFAPFGWCPIS